MKKIFNNVFCDFYISKKDSLIKVVWKAKSENMSHEGFKEIGIALFGKIKEYAPKRIFADSRSFLYIITPDMQTWFFEKVVIPSVKISIKRHAELVSSEIFSQVSIQQLHEEKEEIDLGYVTAYFEDESEALKWIYKS